MDTIGYNLTCQLIPVIVVGRLNSKGHVVGISTASLCPPGAQVGLNLFIPINDGLKFIGVELKD